MENKNQPAFPVNEETTDRIDAEIKIYSGLSKREYVATIALQGMLAKSYDMKGHTEKEIEGMTYDAARFADYLLAELER